MSRPIGDIISDLMTSQMNLDIAANPEDFEIQVQELFKELYLKEDGIYWFYKGNEKRIELIDEHIAKCNKIKKLLKNGSERMKQLVISAFDAAETLPKHTDFNPLKVRESSGAVDIIDESKIPSEYWIKVESTKLDKKRILEELRKGTKVPGVRIIKKKFVGGFR
jgi:hypothetical protein